MKAALDTFSKRLRQLREEFNLSQEAMAERINISRVSIVNYESGKRTPDIEVIASLSREFNISSDYLLGLSDFRDAKTVDGLMASYRQLEGNLNKLFTNQASELADSISSIITESHDAYIAGYVLISLSKLMDQLNFITGTFNDIVGKYIGNMESFHRDNPIHVDQEAAADGYGCDDGLLEEEQAFYKQIHSANFVSLTSSGVGEVATIFSNLLKQLTEALPLVLDHAYDENHYYFN